MKIHANFAIFIRFVLCSILTLARFNGINTKLFFLFFVSLHHWELSPLKSATEKKIIHEYIMEIQEGNVGKKFNEERKWKGFDYKIYRQ